MSYKRFFKKCEEFSICGVIGDAADIDMDGAMDNNTIYHIVIKGSGRLGTPFDSTSIVASHDKNNFVNEPWPSHLYFEDVNGETQFELVELILKEVYRQPKFKKKLSWHS